MKNILFTLALLVSFSSFGQTAEEFYNLAKSKHDLKDFSGAIESYSKSIELGSYIPIASYYGRADSKQELKNYEGAIEDYNRVLEIAKDYLTEFVYFNRGVCKYYIEDSYSAISDFTESINIKPDNAGSYDWRGAIKYELGDLKGACIDWNKAKGLGSEFHAKNRLEYCN